MKSRRSLYSKSGNPRNGAIQKSPSASCVNNNSITSMFKRQQQRWDAMWATVSNTPMETNSSPLVSAEGELHLCEDRINDDKQMDDIFHNDLSSPPCYNKNNQPIFNHIEKVTCENCNILATESAGVKKPTVQNNSLVPVSNQKDPALFEHSAGQSNDCQSLSNTVPIRRLSLKRKRRSLEKGSVTGPSSHFPGRPETVGISASSDGQVLFNSELSNTQTRDDAPLIDTRRILDSVVVNDFFEKPEPTSLEPDRLTEAASGSSSTVEPKHTEYYLENFLLILDVVMADEYYSGLFDENDKQTVHTFRHTLNDPARKLYVRLFLRKHKWLRREKIIYPLIAEDLTETLNELTSNGLLNDDSCMLCLEEAVQCLPAPELKSLAKSLHINPSSKASLSSAIVKHAQRCDVTNFFSQTTGSTQKMIMKRTKTLLGRCYKLADDKRSIFIRIMILFGLHNTIGDDEAYGQQLIFQMLMNQIGRVKYPEYKVLRKTRIFANRETVIRYAEALQLESDLCQELEKKDYDKCLKMYLEAKGTAESLLANPQLIGVDMTLPLHLRPFTPGAIHVRLLTHGVEILQFVKKYEDAVTQLRQLLDQSVYHRDYRGRWYDRLALNLDYHLKRPLEALEVIQLALNDDNVRTGHRYNLLQRAKKICSSSTIKKLTSSAWDPFQDDSMNSVREAPSVLVCSALIKRPPEGHSVRALRADGQPLKEVTISGQQLYRSLPGSGSVWLSTDNSEPSVADAKVITRVEEVALRHYAENGFPEGIHGEGSTFRCLFSLFMWDILFIDNIEDVFYNEYQTYPLDILGDSFYTSRETEITGRLERIASSSSQELCDIVSEAWNQHQDTLCFGINWELFRDCNHAVGLVRCFGGRILAGVFDRMVRLMRSVTGGVPDLVVWNPDSEKFKVVEVKGPGDRLSSKQILWLDYLLQIGVDAEVCHVKAVGAKTLSNTR